LKIALLVGVSFSRFAPAWRRVQAPLAKFVCAKSLSRKRTTGFPQRGRPTMDALTGLRDVRCLSAAVSSVLESS
jgi:hypothetical protein